MLRVLIVASSRPLRARLRSLVESPEGRDASVGAPFVVEEMESPDDVLLDAWKGGRGGGAVLLLGEDHLLDEWGETGEERHLALVILAADGDAASLASRLRTMDLRGWVVLPSSADGDQTRAALAAADAGLALVPPDAVPADRASDRPNLGRRRVETDEEDGFAEPLTPREQQVLDLLARGLSNRAIATELGISDHTAKFHVASVLAKLGAANRADAVRRAVRRGLVPL